MTVIEQLNESKIVEFMKGLLAFAFGDKISASGSAGPWGPWPFP
ncbi:MAG: hypothetical protein ACTSRW_15530 [Candidatus Helarchaeota archaeon]